MKARLLPVVFSLLLTGVAHAATLVDEGWYVIRFQGQHAGWMHHKTVKAGDRLTGDAEIQITLQRGPATISIGMTSSFVETEGGKPISATTVQKFAGQAVEKRIMFTDQALMVTSRQFGQEHTQKLPPVGSDWLTPAAAQRYVAEKTAAGEKVVKFRTFDATAALEPFDVTVENLGEKNIEVYGKVVPALERTAVMSILPTVKTTEYTDADGKLLKTSIDLGGMQMEMVAADKKLALAKVDPPEMLVGTLIKPDFALLKPRQMRKAAFRLELRNGTMPALPESETQRVERVDNRTAIVRINLDEPQARPVAQAPTVVHNVMMNGKDELVSKLTQQALARADGKSAAEKAETLRRFVHRYIRTSDLSVGMASASEVARTKVGDCTEYAVLLGGMLKAAGIPAEFASGLIYVNDFAGQQRIFGYHAWTRAWIDGRWVDLDATLDETPFDATHILLNSSELSDPALANDMVDLLPLIGNLTIKLAD